MTGRRAVFVDRDGVVNQVVPDPQSGLGESPLRVADVELIPGAGTALAQLREAGWLVVCVTNQPAAAKGSIRLSGLMKIHEHILTLLAEEKGVFDGVRMCLHHPDGVVGEFSGVCACRKPQPGMLLEAAAEYGIDLARSWMIGDTDADVLAGRAVGVRTVLVSTEGTAHKRSGSVRADVVAENIGDAAAKILAGDLRGRAER
jgi:D-glycero-D-manno-heptose 1,7-bisphosphate phosphatase